ncbi:Peptidase C1A, papain C-terminal [Sesbania bispinosa]|nr:Peptidase C1A, papain C-terminal [Sesbania bispinosa]
MALILEKISIATILIFLWACTSHAFYESSSIAKQHDEWMASFGRVYADDAEKARRQQIFIDNLRALYKPPTQLGSSNSTNNNFAYQIEDGCGGSLPEKAFDYIAQSQGLASEAEYPYKGTDGTCNDVMMMNPAAKISGYEDVPSQSEEDLLKAVANQPVSVGIDASGRAFQFYNGGLFSGECGTQLNHAVTLIGYGETEETNVKYWLVRNSWGKDWGEGGYMKMQRDVGSPQGLCGVNLHPSYPTV